MLNNNTQTVQNLNVSELLLNANWQSVEEETFGAIFTKDKFAKGWDSIYVNPQELTKANVFIKMRKLTSPTLVITSRGSQMAYIMASDDAPVFLANEFRRDTEYGYIMAFRLAPMASPEYIYYMCKYDEWKRLLSRIAPNETESFGIDFHWGMIGVDMGYDPVTYKGLFLTAEDLVRSSGNLSIPSIAIQKERIQAAKEQSKVEIQNTKKKKPTVADILPAITKYLDATKVMFEDGPRRIGLLRELYKLATGTNANSKVIQILSNQSYPFTEGVLDDDELARLAKYLDTVFDILIDPSEFSWEDTGAYMQPKEVTDFVVSLGDFKNGDNIYNPFSGLASYAIALDGCAVYGEELNQTTWAISQIKLFANGVKSTIVCGDSFREINSAKKYDSIISSPIFLKEQGKQPLEIVNKLYDKLNDYGQLICLIPTDSLSKPEFGEIRDRFISERAVKSVITLPSNIFNGTSMSQTVIVLTKNIKNDIIFFGNASEFTRFSSNVYRLTAFDWVLYSQAFKEDIQNYNDTGVISDKCVSAPILYEAIRGNNLTPAPYLIPIPENGIKLGNLVEIIPQVRKIQQDIGLVATIPAIPANFHDKPFVPKVGKESDIPLPLISKVNGDIIILARSKQAFHSVYVQNFHGIISSPDGVILLLKPKVDVSARYLAALLATKNVQDQIKASCAGTNALCISNKELLNVVVPFHRTPEEREKLISEVISSEISEKERELSDRLELLQTGLRFTRHAMVQTWSALQTNWEEIEFFVRNNGGHMSLCDVIGDVNPITVKDMMASIKHSLKTLSNQIDSLKPESVNWGETKEIDPFEFINRYISQHTSSKYKMTNVGNKNWADFACEKFKAPERKVERILDNIVANAVAHGFTDSKRTDYAIIFDWFSNDEGIVITIANNGTSFKEGVTGDLVLTRGFTTALNPSNHMGIIHSGQGGFEIKELMEGIGTVRVISDPDSEFSVRYELVFTNTNYEIIDIL